MANRKARQNTNYLAPEIRGYALKITALLAVFMVLLQVAPGHAQSYYTNPPIAMMAGCRAYVQNHVQPDFNAGFDYRTGRAVTYGTDAASAAFFACLQLHVH